MTILTRGRSGTGAVHWDPEKAPEMFKKIMEDDTKSIDKDLCSDTGGI